jgi:hypothetical protein
VDSLRLLAENPINMTRGSHLCAFCLKELQSNSPGIDGKLIIQSLRGLGGLGNGEIVVTDGTDACYFAPTLVLHYVEVHGYRPPDEFIGAVMRDIL